MIRAKTEMVRLKIRQNRMASDIKMDPTRLCRILNEWLLPSTEEQKRIEAYLAAQGSKISVQSRGRNR
jgi:hypothetical protein